MEILNKDDEIERLVAATGFDFWAAAFKVTARDVSDMTVQIVVQRDTQPDRPYL